MNLEQSQTSWIPRKLADEIDDAIRSNSGEVIVFVIEAGAGIGKTFLARDIGTRLGSVDGYKPARTSTTLWSGILDIYDPDTNSNLGVEKRLLAAFQSDDHDFEEYDLERRDYDLSHKSGITGSNLESQRKKVEAAFAKGLQEVADSYLPVLAFDTTERLAGTEDPTQREAQSLFDDTASLTGWLVYQITQMKRGVVLLLGRPSDRWFQGLNGAIETARNTSNATSRPLIKVNRTPLQPLDAGEIERMFNTRLEQYGYLLRLKPMLKQIIVDRTAGRPLLIDLALHSLAHADDPADLERKLSTTHDLVSVEQALLDSYINNRASPDSASLLKLLGITRNGLSESLLRQLESSDRSARLWPQLQTWESEHIPFLKIREIRGEKTYFLHDAMYSICDAMLHKDIQFVLEQSAKVQRWYDSRLAHESIQDQNRASLLAESLLYRMRANPVSGYTWFLQESDLAIRSAETSTDQQLKDSMALYVQSAMQQSYQTIDSLVSPIDIQIIKDSMPQLADVFAADSDVLWIKRFTIRGQYARAKDVAEMGGLARAATRYKTNPQQYGLAYAEMLLYYGQVLMYGYNLSQARNLYAQAISVIESTYPLYPADRSAYSDFERRRLSLIVGRTRNNLGFVAWMYEGKYSQAIQEFQRAVRVFQNADSPDKSVQEELANTRDNIGRAYSAMGQNEQALDNINRGLKVREAQGLRYRAALSRLSLALARMGNSKLETASRVIDGALEEFRAVNVPRGSGLGFLARGTILRRRAEAWKETDKPYSDALDYAQRSENDLLEAIRIFSKVNEPIRLVQARNELACLYRARCFLYKDDDNSLKRDQALVQAQKQFREVIQLAKTHQYEIEELDAMQDLAVLLFRVGKLDEAARYADQVSQRIPESHKVRPNTGLPVLSTDNKIDAYYKLMGQVESLNAAIANKDGKTYLFEGKLATPSQTQRLLATLEHYVLAVIYFERFADLSYVRAHTYRRISERFAECPPQLAQAILSEHLPRMINAYKAPGDFILKTFRDVFGLLRVEE